MRPEEVKNVVRSIMLSSLDGDITLKSAVEAIKEVDLTQYGMSPETSLVIELPLTFFSAPMKPLHLSSLGGDVHVLTTSMLSKYNMARTIIENRRLHSINRALKEQVADLESEVEKLYKEIDSKPE